MYDAGKDAQENALAAIQAVRTLQDRTGSPKSLRPYISGELPSREELVDVVKRTTGHITCNPRPLTEDLMWTIFNMVL